MFGDELLINKCPYLGHSENLIENLSIIGYKETSIPILITFLKERNNNNINNDHSKNKNPYPPTTLSSIKDYGIVDNEILISQLYPENPKLILKKANQPEPEKSSVIYSFSLNSYDGKDTISYTCFEYKFYELYKDSNSDDEYYIPKALCIISQFSFLILFI